jgi:ribonuclease BN (tRNA processing enzyme)
MIFEGKVNRLSSDVIRLGDDLAYVDMVRTSQGWVRVGAMPEVAKLLRQARTPPHYVVVQPTLATQVGDGITGEEFICWTSLDGMKFAGTYVGTETSLQILRRYLDLAVPFYLTEDQTAIERRDWLETLYCPHPVDSEGEAAFGSVRIRLGEDRVRILDGRAVVYDQHPKPARDLPERVQAALDRVARWQASRDDFRVLVVGAGNGHVANTSSFLLVCGERLVWVDPAPRPHETLGSCGVHWDDVTDLLLTHTHEDHMGGLTACLARARDRRQRVSLWATRSAFDAVHARVVHAVPQLPSLVDWHEIVPGQPGHIGPVRFEFRLNHHNLPSGTLGLKATRGGRSVGISGDTKYDEAIIRRLNRPELEAAWFQGCQLLFHEIDLARPRSVHSYYPEVVKLARRVSGRVLVYHAVGNTAPLEMAREGTWYDIS